MSYAFVSELTPPLGLYFAIQDEDSTGHQQHDAFTSSITSAIPDAKKRFFDLL